MGAYMFRGMNMGGNVSRTYKYITMLMFRLHLFNIISLWLGDLVLHLLCSFMMRTTDGI